MRGGGPSGTAAAGGGDGGSGDGVGGRGRGRGRGGSGSEDVGGEGGGGGGRGSGRGGGRGGGGGGSCSGRRRVPVTGKPCRVWPSLPAASTAESMPEACRAILHTAGSLPSEISPWQPSIA